MTDHDRRSGPQDRRGNAPELLRRIGLREGDVLVVESSRLHGPLLKLLEAHAAKTGAYVLVAGNGSRVRLLRPEEGDVLAIVNGETRFIPELMRRLAEEGVLVVALKDNQTLAHLDEAAMRAAGWARAYPAREEEP